MILLFVAIVVVGYAVAASRAAFHGTNRLWVTAIVSLLLISIAVAFLGWYYAVPSIPRLLLYGLTLTGPIVCVPTTMLLFTPAARPAAATSLPKALLGACLGCACGFLFAVFGLRGW